MDAIGFKSGCDYTMEKFLGEGAFGSVFKIRSITTQKSQALKVYYAREFRIYDIMEIFLTRYMDHPNIIRCLKVLHQDECYGKDKIACVLPLARTDSSAFMNSKKQFDAFGLLPDIVPALLFLHDNHIIHSDIKPQNILVMSKDRFVLADFGLALVCPSFPHEYVTRGTELYMYPGAFLSNGNYLYSPWTDIYALGLTVYKLATRDRSGKHPGLEGIEKNIKDPQLRYLLYHMLATREHEQWTLKQIASYLQVERVADATVYTPLVAARPSVIYKSVTAIMDGLCLQYESSMATVLHMWDLYFLAQTYFSEEDLYPDGDPFIILTDGKQLLCEVIAQSLFATASFFASDLGYTRWNYLLSVDMLYVLDLSKKYDSTLYRPCLLHFTDRLSDLLVQQYLVVTNPAEYETYRVDTRLKDTEPYNSVLTQLEYYDVIIDPNTYSVTEFSDELQTFMRAMP